VRRTNELSTERLILSPLVAADSNDLFSARGDGEVMAHWDALPDATQAETAAVTRLLLAEMESGISMYWTIRLRDKATFVGVSDLSEIRRGKSAELGFIIAREFWGLGFGSEVGRCLLSRAKAIGLQTITARIHSGNTRSELLLSKLGFEIVEEMPRYEIRPGTFRDCLRLEYKLS
jgi:ribosomal-protein-alanine N-acetyltransferase